MEDWTMILADIDARLIVWGVIIAIMAIGALINKVRESRQADERRQERAARSQTDEGRRETQTRMDRLNDLAERRRQQLQELARRRRDAAAPSERVSDRPRPTSAPPAPPAAERRVDAEADRRRQAARRAEMERREAAQRRAEAQRQAEVQRREALRRRAEQKAQHEAERARRAARQRATSTVEDRHLEPSVDDRRVRRSPRRVSKRMEVAEAQPGHKGQVHRHVPDAQSVTKDQAAPWVGQLKDLDRTKLR